MNLQLLMIFNNCLFSSFFLIIVGSLLEGLWKASSLQVDLENSNWKCYLSSHISLILVQPNIFVPDFIWLALCRFQNKHGYDFLPCVFLEIDIELWLFFDFLVIRGVLDSWNLLSLIREELTISTCGTSFMMLGRSFLSVCISHISRAQHSTAASLVL